MGTCNCGVRPVIKPTEGKKETEEKKETKEIKQIKQHNQPPQQTIKHMEEHSRSNLLLYMLLVGIFIIILLLVNRDC